MLIVYQIRSHHHKTIDLPNEECPICKEKTTLQMHMMQKYMWWIGPMAPANKYAVLECQSCQKTIPNRLWTDEFDAIYTQNKVTIKTPFRMWRGLIVIPSIFLILYISIKLGVKNPLGLRDDTQTLSEVSEAVKNVKVNDVYFASMIEGSRMTNFKVIKITKIENDKAYIKIYPEPYQNFQDMYDIEKADLDESKFSKEEKIIQLEGFKANQNLVEYKEDNFIAFGRVQGEIK